MPVAAEEADLPRVDLEGDWPIVAVAGQRCEESAQRQRALARQHMGPRPTRMPGYVAEMDVAEHGAHDLVALHEVLSVGAGMAGVESHAAVARLREAYQRLQIIKQVA